jgi:hypothetical protein
MITTDALFGDGLSVFAVLDGASVPGLLEKLDAEQPNCMCLYLGELEPDVAECAPYLVELQPGSFADWVIRKGGGNHWGIFALTESDLPAMRKHFRRFLTVYSEEGNPMLFRFYDPRVLRTFLPTCTPEELAEFFGPVQAYVVEGEHAADGLRFELQKSGLVEKRLPPAA